LVEFKVDAEIVATCKD